MDKFESKAINKTEDILKTLFDLQDKRYLDFTSSLTPSVDKSRVIGVRVPQLRQLAKMIKGTDVANEFMAQLPHTYLEENHLHGYLLEYERDFYKAVAKLKKFLPFIDNWATCDTIRPKVFKKHTKELIPYISEWIESDSTYTVRYAIGLLLSFYLDEEFDKSHLEMVSGVKSEEYYINMMIAWYFATALAKQYDHTIPYLENKVLSKWTHNKTIQKALESYRVDDKIKAYLRTLKIK